MSGVSFEIDGGIALVRLENPEKLNALTSDMVAALDAACERIEAHPEIRGMILTGTGEKAFCVGADIVEWGALSPVAFARLWVRRGHRVFDRIAQLPVPTIAAMNGHALGGGLELAATCDVRIMAPDATIGLPETGVGIVPGWSGTQRVAREVPPAILREMVLFGRRIGAERARETGFANAVEPSPLEAARALAGRLSARGSVATETAKHLIAAAYGEAPAAAVEALGGALTAASEEKAEGVAAFREKRKPDFGGTA